MQIITTSPFPIFMFLSDRYSLRFIKITTIAIFELSPKRRQFQNSLFMHLWRLVLLGKKCNFECCLRTLDLSGGLQPMLLTNATVPVTEWKEPSSVHICNSKGFKALWKPFSKWFESDFEEILVILKKLQVILKKFQVILKNAFLD